MAEALDADSFAADNFKINNLNLGFDLQSASSIPNAAVPTTPEPTSIPAAPTIEPIAYIHSEECLAAANRLPRIALRADRVHSLIEAYGLLRIMRVEAPVPATFDDLCRFHSAKYMKVLRKVSALDEDDDDKRERAYIKYGDDYGIGYDCPVPPGLYNDISLVTGATITGARLLNAGDVKVAINWCGGWHHAKKFEASGFCYVNDIVLAIQILREKHSRILYIDLDLHHGDGVQDAFYSTQHIMTVSFHRYDGCFYPGTGAVMESGSCRGVFHCVNVPLREGIKDYEFFSIFTSTMAAIRENYDPEAVVMQCGADGLAGDPMDSFNLTHQALARCVHLVRTWDLPLLILGGGGYNFAHTAICWTYITGILLKKQLAKDIPDHKYFTDYGPTFELAVVAGNRLNYNPRSYLIDIYSKVLTNLKRLKRFADELSEKHRHKIEM